MILRADSEDTDLTGRIPFGAYATLLLLSRGGSYDNADHPGNMFAVE